MGYAPCAVGTFFHDMAGDAGPARHQQHHRRIVGAVDESGAFDPPSVPEPRFSPERAHGHAVGMEPALAVEYRRQASPVAAAVDPNTEDAVDGNPEFVHHLAHHRS